MIIIDISRAPIQICSKRFKNQKELKGKSYAIKISMDKSHLYLVCVFSQ